MSTSRPPVQGAPLRLWISGAVSPAAEAKFRQLMRSFRDDSAIQSDFAFEESIFAYDEQCPGYVSRGTKDSELRARANGSCPKFPAWIPSLTLLSACSSPPGSTV